MQSSHRKFDQFQYWLMVIALAQPAGIVVAEGYYWEYPSIPIKYRSAAEACAGLAAYFPLPVGPIAPSETEGEHVMNCSVINTYPWGVDWIQWAGAAYRTGDACPTGLAYNNQTGQCVDKSDSDCPRTRYPIEILEAKKLKFELDYQSADGSLRFERQYATYKNWSATLQQWVTDGGWDFGLFDRRVEMIQAATGGIALNVNLNFVRSDHEIINFFGTHPVGDLAATIFPPNSNAQADAAPLVDSSGNLMGWKLQFWDSDTERYGSSGNLTSVLHADGTVLELDSTASTRSMTNLATGQSIVVTPSNGRIDSMTDPDGRQYFYGYDGSERLTKVTFPDDTADPSDNPYKTYHYEDSNFPNLVTGISGERGVRYSTWQYDTEGRAILSKNEPPTATAGIDQTTMNYAFYNDSTDPRVIVTNQFDQDTIYHFAEFNGMKKVTYVERSAYTHPIDTDVGCDVAFEYSSYDANGFKNIVVDWESKAVDYDYDSRGLEIQREEGLSAAVSAGNPPVITINTPKPIEARVITTNWHPNFRLPTRITKPDQVIGMSYDCDTGEMSARQVWPPDSEPAYVAPACP